MSLHLGLEVLSTEGWWNNMKTNISANKLSYNEAAVVFKQCAQKLNKLNPNAVNNCLTISIDRGLHTCKTISGYLDILIKFMKFFASKATSAYISDASQDAMIDFCYDNENTLKLLEQVHAFEKSSLSLKDLGYSKENLSTVLLKTSTMLSILKDDISKKIEWDILAGWDSDTIFGAMKTIKTEVFSICKNIRLIE